MSLLDIKKRHALSNTSFFTVVAVLLLAAGLLLLQGGTGSRANLTIPAQAQGSCGQSVCQNDSTTFTIALQASDCSIDTFNRFGSGDITTEDTFRLDWDTTDAATVTGTQGPGGWTTNNPKGSSGPSGDLGPLSAGTYTYEIQCANADGTQTNTDTTSITVRQPTFFINTGGDTPELDGQPGSTAETEVSITAEAGYDDGPVDVSIPTAKLPADLREGGESLIEFTFDDSTLSVGESTTLQMETIRPIRVDDSHTIVVDGVDQAGTEKEGSFQLITNEFISRTIEEF